MTDHITLARPDDWHLHLREGETLEAVAPHSARLVARALVMPNLQQPIETGEQAQKYKREIIKAIPEGSSFEPLMTLYLTENTSPGEIEKSFREKQAHAVKLYPAGATTNSEFGVQGLDEIMDALEKMAEIEMSLSIHGESTDPEVDIFDREEAFIERVLNPLRKRLPELKITLEHITTRQAVEYVMESSGNLAATITAHHLILNRNHLLAGGLKPHYYCMPLAKREEHRIALRKAAVSGDPRFFFGSDSAPHLDRNKESNCGCAGCFTAPVAIECLAHVFEQENAINRLDGFCSLHGANWHGLPVNQEQISLAKRNEPIHSPSKIRTQEGNLTVFDPMFPIQWEANPK